jgi:hypothetical protein
MWTEKKLSHRVKINYKFTVSFRYNHGSRSNHPYNWMQITMCRLKDSIWVAVTICGETIQTPTIIIFWHHKTLPFLLETWPLLPSTLSMDDAIYSTRLCHKPAWPKQHCPDFMDWWYGPSSFDRVSTNISLARDDYCPDHARYRSPFLSS